MKSFSEKLSRWLRSMFCRHTTFLRNLERQADGTVTCPCNKCAAVLRADYGLALKTEWEPDPELLRQTSDLAIKVKTMIRQYQPGK